MFCSPPAPGFLDDRRAVLFAVLYKHFDGAAALTAVRGGEVKIDVICRVGKFDVFVALLRKITEPCRHGKRCFIFWLGLIEKPGLILGDREYQRRIVRHEISAYKYIRIAGTKSPVRSNCLNAH